MPRSLDLEVLRRQLHALLSGRGPMSARDARRVLGISQPSFSRLVDTMDDVVKIGRSRATRYAVRRAIAGLDAPIPLYRVGAEGQLAEHGVLVPIEPDLLLFCHDSHALFEDLPWFLQDLRPLGYLGRQVPRRHPELGLPPDLRRWSTDHVLVYLARFGWNAPGDWILGEQAAARYLAHAASPPDGVPADGRAATYVELAEHARTMGPVGSSAAGEQPKFLAIRMDDAGPTPVLIKFSPPMDSPVGRRVADLLLCEHLALRTLREGGHEAAHSSFLRAGGRAFLEVERFDRMGWPGRRGVVSLEALNGAFAREASDWVRTTRALIRAGVCPSALEQAVVVQHAFGRLIANTDMHFGNLSFYAEHDRVTGLAPAYDMLPTGLAPRGQELVPTSFEPPAPEPSAAWRRAWEMACTFWSAVCEDERIHADLREEARRIRAALEAQATTIALLPS